MADSAPDTCTGSNINSTSFRFQQFCATNPDHAPHPVISELDLTRLDHTHFDNQIPDFSATNGDAETRQGKMQCCCGRPDCAYLEHNNAALGGLERDLETAARLGQALLDRHEAYVKESQAEQARMSSHIADLEDEKTHLQDANHRIVVENRELLQKLEQLNFDFGESGKRVNELEDLLQDCEQEIRRLNGLTRKTQDLELKVLDMEKERATLNKTFEDGRSETRSTIARWRESERKIKALEQEMQKIEWAAKVDREKHEQIVARIERERALERELALSEGRLKATAAVQNMQHGGQQKQVVSNFVRDILQDNANLQEGIAELRELLQSSNDEVQNLRDQILLHQPISGSSTPVPQRQVSLSEELEYSQSLPKQIEKEVHVHHHYHTKFGSKKPKTPIRRTPRRRATPSASALSSSPSSGSSTPMLQPKNRLVTPVSPLIIQPPRNKANRWSMQSTATNSTYMSSMASSPRSYFDRNNSIFDRMEREEELSRPTSPESLNLASPLPYKRAFGSDDHALSVFEEENLDGEDDTPDPDSSVPEQPVDHDTTPQIQIQPSECTPLQSDASTQPEITPKASMSFKPDVVEMDGTQSGHITTQRQDEVQPATSAIQPTDQGRDGLDIVQHHTPRLDASPSEQQPAVMTAVPEEPTTDFRADLEIRPSIRRANSHDSLLSISGMDIHLAQHPRTPKSALQLLGTPSRLANKHHFAPTPASLRRPLTSTMQPVAAVTEFTATSRHDADSPSASLLALHGMQSSTSMQQQNRGLMGTVGGWMTGKWGRAPTPMRSNADLRSAASSSPRPSFSSTQFSTAPSMVKSDGASTFSNSTSSTAPGKRSVSANAMEIPAATTNKTPSLSSSVKPASFMGRPPGINQAGFIPGFAAAVAAKKTPTVLAPQVNADMLHESLAE